MAQPLHTKSPTSPRHPSTRSPCWIGFREASGTPAKGLLDVCRSNVPLDYGRNGL